MKKIIPAGLVSYLAIIPYVANAEIKPLDDETLGNMTGQAGITIELEAKIDIGEVNYKDQGNIFLTGISFGGIGSVQSKYGESVTFGESFDNAKITIDVAGDAADSANLIGQLGLGKFNAPTSSGDLTELANTGSHGETIIPVDDGDLVITLGALNTSERVDYGLTIDKVSLAESYYTAGDSLLYSTGTVLMSQLHVVGDIGSVDIIVDGSSNQMNINAYFSAFGFTSLDFIGTSFDFAFTNSRGNDVLGYQYSNGDVISFAHAQVNISQEANPSRGIRVDVMDLSGDMDLTNIRFGNAPTIGDVYMTDISVQASLSVSGH